MKKAENPNECDIAHIFHFDTPTKSGRNFMAGYSSKSSPQEDFGQLVNKTIALAQKIVSKANIGLKSIEIYRPFADKDIWQCKIAEIVNVYGLWEIIKFKSEKMDISVLKDFGNLTAEIHQMNQKSSAFEREKVLTIHLLRSNMRQRTIKFFYEFVRKMNTAHLEEWMYKRQEMKAKAENDVKNDYVCQHLEEEEQKEIANELHCLNFIDWLNENYDFEILLTKKEVEQYETN
jgi:hypothetical protein